MMYIFYTVDNDSRQLLKNGLVIANLHNCYEKYKCYILSALYWTYISYMALTESKIIELTLY